MNTYQFEQFIERFHPFLASLPFGIIAVSFLFLILGLRNGGPLNVSRNVFTAGLVLVLAAYLSGDFAREGASKTFLVDENAIAFHHQWAKVLLLLTALTTAFFWLECAAVFGRRGIRAVILVLSTLSIVTAAFTGYLGGELVFEHGAGVRALNIRTPTN